MNLPGWVFYREHTSPKEGDLFVVEKVEDGMKDMDGEQVTYVTLRRWRVEMLEPKEVDNAVQAGGTEVS